MATKRTAVIELDDGVVGPEILSYLFPQNNVAGARKQYAEDLKRLFLETNLRTVLGQLAGPGIEFKWSKAERTGR